MKIELLILTTLLSLYLLGCSNPNAITVERPDNRLLPSEATSEEKLDSVESFITTQPEGEYRCFVYKEMNAGGLSCTLLRAFDNNYKPEEVE